MSYFTVAVNGLLERMKTESKFTRQHFAERIGMSLSTLSSYTTGRTKPDSSALQSMCAGLPEPDARAIVVAHLCDEAPESWRSRVSVVGHTPTPCPMRLADLDDLSPTFRRNVELLLGEARSNEHVIGLIAELVALLGLEGRGPAQLWSPPAKFPVQPVPLGIVHSKNRHGDSTPRSENALRVAENPPVPAKISPGPRARSTHGGIRKTDAAKKEN